MLVVVVFVGRMPMAVVNVVHVITMRNCHMSALVTVCVVVSFMHEMLRRLALIEVTLVWAMEVPIVDVVDMVAMRDRDMAAPHPMCVVVPCVFLVRSSHREKPPFQHRSVRHRLFHRIGMSQFKCPTPSTTIIIWQSTHLCGECPINGGSGLASVS